MNDNGVLSPKDEVFGGQVIDQVNRILNGTYSSLGSGSGKKGDDLDNHPLVISQRNLMQSFAAYLKGGKIPNGGK